MLIIHRVTEFLYLFIFNVTKNMKMHVYCRQTEHKNWYWNTNHFDKDIGAKEQERLHIQNVGTDN